METETKKKSVRKAKQKSLYEYLYSTDSLLAEITPLREVSDLVIRSAIDHSSQVFRAYRSHIYVGELKNVVLVKRKYFLTVENDFLAEGLTHSDYFITWAGFDDSGLGRGSQLVRENALIDIEEDALREFKRPCIFIGGDSINEPNFAHWFFEHLLKVRALILAGVDMDLPLIVSDRVPVRYLEWADRLAERQLNWERIDLSGYVTFSSALVSSCPAYRRKGDAAPTIWDFGFDYLASAMLRSTANSERESPNHDKVYFISRRKAKWRRAVNETELFEIAQRELGAQMLDMSVLSIEEQIMRVRHASVLILFAGADGPITTFCNPRAKVIEFAAPNHAALYTSPIFCAIRGIRWLRIVGEKFVSGVLGPHPLDRDYWVDPKAASFCFRRLAKFASLSE
jgi:hypothetical protein